MTLSDAALLARTLPEEVTAALRSGDLRDLRRSNVDMWVRARIAASAARRLSVA